MKGTSSVRAETAWTAVIVALFAMGCTAIAGVEDPEQGTEASRAATDPAPSHGSPDEQPPAATTMGASTNANGDAGAAADASPSQSPSTQCTVPVNQACERDSDCNNSCGKCNEDGRCVNSCRKQWDSCDVGSGAAPCCKGLFCSTSFGYPSCQPCIGAGFQVTSSDPRACCSGQTSSQGGKVYCK